MSTTAPGTLPGHKSQTWILIATTSAMVLMVLDSSIVGVMLPSIQRELSLTPSDLAWVVSVYLLSLAVLLPIGGRVVDVVGARTAFVTGMAGFAAASAGIGFSGTDWQLILWRGLAGFAAALLMPAALAILTASFEPESRARAMAVYTGVGQGFATVGPAVGGVCAEFLSWRWGFWINVPIGLAGIALTVLARPENRRTPVKSWDVPGILALLVGLSGLVLALLQLPEWGATPPTLIAAGIGLLATAWFVRRELTTAHPLLNLRIFGNSHFSAGTVVLFCLGFGMTIATIYCAVVLQDSIGLTPATSGLALLPMVIPLLIATRWIAKSYNRVGPRRIGIAGCIVLTVGLGIVATGLPSTSALVICVGLVPVGVGIGLLLSPMTIATLGVVADDERGAASGIISTARQLGSIIGVGIMSALVTAFATGAVAGFLVAGAVMLVGAGCAAAGFPGSRSAAAR